MNGADEVFVDDYQLLQEVYAQPTRAGLRYSSAVLRRWFIDGTKLIDIVNRPPDRRHPIEFTVGFRTDLPRPSYRRSADVAYSNIGPPADTWSGARSTVSRDRFLGLETGTYKGHPLTVREVVLFYANSQGGVHFDPVKPGEVNDMILQVSANLKILGVDWSAKVMYAIVHQALVAAEPIYFQITEGER